MAIRRILFAVKDPEAARQPGIGKAIRIARSFGASLELFHSLTSPVIVTVPADGAASIDALRARSIGRVRARLAKYVAIARRRGVTLDHWATWDYPPHEAIVRRAAQIRADLIVAECHHGSRARRWITPLTDWELLRASELPVLLVRSARPYRRPVVLAAVDPSHARAKPARLDADILSAATQFSVAFQGRLHTVFANYPPLGLLALGDPGLDARTLAMNYEALEQQGHESYERFMAARDLEPARQHLVHGPPAREIPDVARKVRASLVVMGAVSRSRLQRMFIGHTAERVLDALPCDVLVIKPRGTRTAVEPRPRGMRVLRAPATPLVA